MRWLLIPLLFICSLGFTQDQHHIDSLKARLEMDIHDSLRIKFLINLGEEQWIFRTTYWDSIINMCRYNIRSSPNSKPQITPLLATATNNLALIYHRQGKFEPAINFFKESVQLELDNNNKKGAAISYDNLAAVYVDQGDITQALRFRHSALNLSEQINDSVGLSICLSNMGLIYQDQGDVNHALSYLSRSLGIEEKLGNEQAYATVLHNIGAIYKDQSEFDVALMYYRKSLTIRERFEDSLAIAYSCNNLGVVQSIQGQEDSAMANYMRALRIFKGQNYTESISWTYNLIGRSYFEQEKLESALAAAEVGLRIAKEIGSPKETSRNARLISYIERKRGKYKEALDMYELHIQMRDSINNVNTQRATIRQQTKYEFEKEQLVARHVANENLRIKNEKLRRRDNLQYSIILISLLLVFGAVLSLGIIKVSPKVAEGLIFFSFLILFEFVLVLADPYVDLYSEGAPGYKLLFNAMLAGFIFPLHAFFEKVLKTRLIMNSQK